MKGRIIDWKISYIIGIIRAYPIIEEIDHLEEGVLYYIMSKDSLSWTWKLLKLPNRIVVMKIITIQYQLLFAKKNTLIQHIMIPTHNRGKIKNKIHLPRPQIHPD